MNVKIFHKCCRMPALRDRICRDLKRRQGILPQFEWYHGSRLCYPPQENLEADFCFLFDWKMRKGDFEDGEESRKHAR